MIAVKPISEKLDNYIPVPESGCWIWLGCVDRDGYGRINIQVNNKRKLSLAHRASYILHKRPVPEGLHVLHRCDVAECINPDHLYAGTHHQNMRDRHMRNPVIISQEQRDAQSAWNRANPQPKSSETGQFIPRGAIK